MLHPGLELSRHRLDVHLLDAQASTVQVTTAPPDADGLRGLASQTAAHRQPGRAATWVDERRPLGPRPARAGRLAGRIADAQTVKGWPRLPVGPTGSTPGCSPELSRRDLVPFELAAHPRVRAEQERARFRPHLVRHRTALKHRIHATLLAFAKPCPVSDLVGAGGRQLLARLALPEPWIGNLTAALALIDDLDHQIDGCEPQLRHLGADHPRCRC